jgi:hypothetical protein
MATAAEIEQVRNNTNTTTADYSDEVVGDLIDDSSVNCASLQIWRWEYAKLGANAATAIKKATGGIESHEYNSIKDQMEFYKEMIKMYEDLCKEDQGIDTPYLIPTKLTEVGGVVTQDEIDELS